MATRTKSSLGIALIGVLVLVVYTVLAPSSSPAFTYTVTTNNDPRAESPRGPRTPANPTTNLQGGPSYSYECPGGKSNSEHPDERRPATGVDSCNPFRIDTRRNHRGPNAVQGEQRDYDPIE